DVGIGKTTVEVLDKDETPRGLSSPVSPSDGEQRPGEDISVGQGRKVEVGVDLTHERQFQYLRFEEEEGRVRSLADTYVPRCSDTLHKLHQERERLSAIEEAQRTVENTQRKIDYQRSARRKWLAQDVAAETIQRTYRGHIGRRRAELLRETKKVIGEAKTGWIEVRDHDQGEVWYYNTLTGQSQWERPLSILGTLAPPEKVKTLPALNCLPVDGGDGRFPKAVGHMSVNKTDVGMATAARSRAGDNELPPLKGQRQSILALPNFLAGAGVAEARQAWDEDWPFLRQNLPDDRLEEPGLGLASNQDGETDSGEDPGSADETGFFLADGSPNIRLRETISDALRVRKFDSVSTLLADYNSSIQDQEQEQSPGPIAGSNRDLCRATTAAALSKGRRAGQATPGILEDDKNPPLFSCSSRRMVSQMCVGKNKGRRVKTAGAGEHGRRGKGKSRASSLCESLGVKGLAIRDITAPGFTPVESSGGTDHKPQEGKDSEGHVVVGGEHAKGRVEVGENEDGKKKQGEIGAGKKKEQKDICFNCWSKGSGKACTLHGARAGSGGGADSQGEREVRAVESALMCKNWDLGVMRRRYSSEELQEIFMKEASSLRYDKQRKAFVAVVEQHHLIYRLLSHMLANYNFTVRRKLHQRNWMRGFIRMGKVQGKDGGHTAKMIRLRHTLSNIAWIGKYSATVSHLHPRAPITGTTLAERSGLVKVIVDRPSAIMGRTTKCMLDGPMPVPESLYEPREYHLPPPMKMPMPDPKYGEIVEGEQQGGTVPLSHPAAWVEKFCDTTAGGILRLAQTNVEVMSPVPAADQITRTKYPPPLTVKFAVFTRKSTPGNLAVGGLSAEMKISMLVTTYVPPQYGNFTVMQKSSVAPTVSPEVTVKYASLELKISIQDFLPRPLQHPLNNRKAPTIMLKTLMAPTEGFFFGQNRPHQTGEELSHGFRTSAYAEASPALPTLDPTAFTPSADIVSPNLCSANRTVTTHADRSYPFCEPSSRGNTTLDFYHLLLTATCSPNKEQVFTNLGVQECGEFMRGSDPMRAMGHNISMVYRSWAFLQKQALEEFETDDGVPYWFDRRTGETFWERPLCQEEKVPVKDGGTVLSGHGEAPDTSSSAYEDIKPRYDQHQMRRLMKQKHEALEDIERRRKQVATQVKWARESGALPPPDPKDLESPSADPFTDENVSEDGSVIKDRATSGAHSGGSNDTGSLSTTDSFNLSAGVANNARGVAVGAAEGSAATPIFRLPGRGQSSGQKENPAWLSHSSPPTEKIVASITEALATAGLGGGKAGPEDMLRLGMGLGMALNTKGFLLGEMNQMQEQPDLPAGSPVLKGSGATAQLTSTTPAPIKVPGPHPIGHGHPDPVATADDPMTLDHDGEAAHVAAIVKDSAELKTSEEFKGLMVVPTIQPTACPDEDIGSIRPEEAETDPRRKKVLETPIVAYPESLWKKKYQTHGAAGKGVSWRPAGTDGTENQRSETSLGVTMRRTNEPLPEGFLSAISHTHVGKQHCDYLPHVPNLPQARPVGRVRPRSAVDDWLAVGFDPWSAGREPLSAEFVPTLSIKQEDLMTGEGGNSMVPHTEYIEGKDMAGHAEMAVVSAEEAKMAADFEKISSWARHGRYADVETAMNQADWTMPIDYQDNQGICLLHVAAQNGNKRIVKLCLRKGADVNKRTHNGQTPLHYAYGYGFESLGEYLISKGCDDSITNADGLTCYEGLNHDELNKL
ncbi:unnamed protein product, partial [Discosporangium mesarthrocarpum]